MAYENNDKKMESIYSKRIRAGKRRTYFFDVRATRGNDYYLTITESRKRFNDNGYDRHKIFLYKEDFNKFIKALTEAVDHVKTELMPDFDFDAFNHDDAYDNEDGDQQQEYSRQEYSRQESPSVENLNSEAASEKEEDNEPAPATAPTAHNNSSDEEVDKW